MTEDSKMLPQNNEKESWMNGAAIILSDGREEPITDSMVRQSLEALLASNNDNPTA